MTAISSSHQLLPIPSRPSLTPESPAGDRRSPLILALAGLLILAVSAAVLVRTVSAEARRPRPASLGARTVETPAPAVTVADLTYEPSHSSGWHVHSGVHSVVVLSGTLTVYDDACLRHDFGPGETYVGGHQPHLARNLGSDAALLVVTYVTDRATEPNPGTRVPAPAGCEAAA